MRNRGIAIAVAAAIAAGAVASPAAAQPAVEAFFKGRDVQIVIGAGVGGTYGLYSQLAARHLRKHIPGQPNLIMQSMPGAGGNVALNYSYGVAPKDGSVMHLVHAEVLYETLMTEGVKFNARDYNYIGRLADGDSIMVMTKASGVATLEDAKKRETTLGVTGFSNVYALSPLMMNRLAGTRFKVIAGYKSAGDISLAMQRGEIDGSGMSVAQALTSHGERLKSGEFVPVFAIASKRLVLYPNVPAMTELGSAADKTLMEVYASTGTIGRSLAYPPGVPTERVQAVRAAYQKMLEDPDFKAEVAKTSTPIDPMSGEALAAYIADIMKAPAAQIEAARNLHKTLLATK